MKLCKYCLELKPKILFYKESSTKDGLSNRCISCQTEYSRLSYLRNKKNILAQNKVWRNSNLSKARNISKEYREKNKDKVYYRQKMWVENNRERVRLLGIKSRHNNLDKDAAKSGKRRASKLNRTPPWLSKEELNKIKEIYKLAKQLTKKTGIVHHVDHIIPLRGKLVSGLHIFHNLQVITAKDNLVKSNKLIIN